MEKNTIQMSLFDYFLDEDAFSIKDAEELVNNVKSLGVNSESIRARIYEGVEKGIFSKVSRGVYKVESQINGTTSLLINGDGRDLSMIEDSSIDGIVTDHPYDLAKSLKGGNRNFAEYELFRYEEKDFKEKARVLKDGAFLVEFLPEESEANYEYLYNIKKLAEKSGFKYFAKVPWIKGNFVSNTGRKAKNSEDVMIFSKGEPRELKLDAKKNKATAEENGLDVKGETSYAVRDKLIELGLDVAYMKGTNGMLPTAFDYQPKNVKEKIVSAEKPIPLLEEIVEFISKPYETLLDQFAGSGNLVIACTNLKRNSIAIEKDEGIFEKMKENILKNTAEPKVYDTVYGYVFNENGYHNGKMAFEGSPENMANFIMYNQDNETVITDVLDQFLISSMRGGFLGRVSSPELRGEVLGAILPLQRGEMEPFNPLALTEVKPKEETDVFKEAVFYIKDYLYNEFGHSDEEIEESVKDTHKIALAFTTREDDPAVEIQVYVDLHDAKLLFEIGGTPYEKKYGSLAELNEDLAFCGFGDYIDLAEEVLEEEKRQVVKPAVAVRL